MNLVLSFSRNNNDVMPDDNITGSEDSGVAYQLNR
jgi:hypothetical protein